MALFAAIHSSGRVGGIVLLALAPLWYLMYSLIEWLSKRLLKHEYTFSAFQRWLPIVFLVVLGVVFLIKN